ncbi:MAG TPA: GNAT family N-acetyltransferase [bacterium]|jgi:RimJ/RimL family protein N-acetyltransferase
MPEFKNALRGLPLKGRRVTVRSFSLADENLRQAWAKFDDPYLSRYNFTPRQEASNLVLYERLCDRIRLALDDPADNLIGYVFLKPFERDERAMEIGICLSAGHIGRGLGREALELILPWAIESLNLNRIVLDVDEINQRALRLYRRLGFKVSALFWKKEDDSRIADYSKQIGLKHACRQRHGHLEILAWRMEWSLNHTAA